jgi:hypothetical protein
MPNSPDDIFRIVETTAAVPPINAAALVLPAISAAEVSALAVFAKLKLLS